MDNYSAIPAECQILVQTSRACPIQRLKECSLPPGQVAVGAGLMKLELPSDDDEGPSIVMQAGALSMKPSRVDMEESQTPARKPQRLPSLECPDAHVWYYCLV